VATPNLGITHLAAAQNQPEVTVNDQMDQQDIANNSFSSIAMTDANITLSQAQVASGGVIILTGALTANRTVSLPTTLNRVFLFRNGTTGGHSLVLQDVGGTGLAQTITAAMGIVQIAFDGANVNLVTAGSSVVPSFADAEVPSGSGVNFSLAHIPNPAGSLILVQQGIVLKEGVDYTLSVATLTMTNPVAFTDSFLAWYRY
jgi:hypothetical protein